MFGGGEVYILTVYVTVVLQLFKIDGRRSHRRYRNNVRDEMEGLEYFSNLLNTTTTDHLIAWAQRGELIKLHGDKTGDWQLCWADPYLQEPSDWWVSWYCICRTSDPWCLDWFEALPLVTKTSSSVCYWQLTRVEGMMVLGGIVAMMHIEWSWSRGRRIGCVLGLW